MTTPNLGLPLPADGDPAWGGALRAGLTTLDTAVGDDTRAAEEMAEGMRRQRIVNPTPSSALPYAKDANDRLRTVIDNIPAFITHRVRFGNPDATNGGAFTAPYSDGSPNSMDARMEQLARSRTTFGLTRQRWKFT